MSETQAVATRTRLAGEPLPAPAGGDILFLCQRIPYPPNKGEKMRSFHILTHLARTHRVHLGCFVDDEEDVRYIDALRGVCAEIHVARLHPRLGRLWCLRGLATGEPLSLTYFRDGGLARWVETTYRAVRPKAVFVYSSAMAQLVLGLPDDGHQTIMDFVDVDSDKWRQYAETRSWPMSAVYRREARRLLDFDRRVARAADASLFVSAADAELFRSVAAESAQKVHVVGNGIDTEFYDPDAPRERPPELAADGPVMTFTGTMDYWPNVDAVVWFVEDVLPRIRAALPAARFAIVGANPSPRVRQLASHPGVIVTGRVADVRPYIAHADICVAPMRIARGVQNKVLEAMAMAKSVVTTPQGLEGIDAESGRDLLVAEGAESFAASVVEQLTGAGCRAIGAAARARVIARHGWSAQLALLDRLIDGN